MKKKIITSMGVVIVAVLLMSNSSGIANRTGMPGETTCNTSGCHNSFVINTGGGSITINDNIPVSGYVPGQTYSISVVVAKTGMPKFGFDFEAVNTSFATVGNITVSDAASTQTTILTGRQNIIHKFNGGAGSGSKTFSFNWTAPATNVGNITFYTAGLASDNNNSQTNDYVYNTSKVIGCNPLITGSISGSPFCAGTNSIAIPYTAATGTFIPGNVFTAELSDALGSFVSPVILGSVAATTSGTITSTVPLPSAAGSAYRIRIVSTNPVMTGAQNISNLVINQPPTVSSAGANQTVCSTSATMSANSPVTGTGTWSVISGAANIVSQNNPATQITSLGLGDHVLRWTISSPGCTSSVSDVTVTASTFPTAANAGNNQTVCANFVTLNGNVPSIGVGSWSLTNGSGSIVAPGNPGTSVINLGTGLNVFTWKTSSPCGQSTSTVGVLYSGSITVANAGPDQTVCTSTAVLSGNTPTVGVGTWSLISGSGILSSPGNPSTTVTGLGYGNNVFRWIITNSPCTPTFDDVTISTAYVSFSQAGSSQTLCATAGTISANVPQYGTGIWTVASGSANISGPASPTSIVTGLSPGVNNFVWTISNAPCASSSSTMTITQAGSITTANAGTDQSVCSTSTSLAGNVALIGSGSWSLINGSGNIVSPSSPTSAVTSLGIGNNVFRWTITNGACPPSIDDVSINGFSITTANAGQNQVICNNFAILGANTPVYGTGTWSLVSGGGNISTPSNPNSVVVNLPFGINIFQWTIANSPCPSSAGTVAIANCTNGNILTHSISGSPFCLSTSYMTQVNFTATGGFMGYYVVELSDTTGSFSNATPIGTGSASPIPALIPPGSFPGTKYRVRVSNTSPYTPGSDNGNDLSVNTCNPDYIDIGSISGSPFCENTSYDIAITFTANGTVPGVFIAELSDSAGAFTNPRTIGYNYSSPLFASIPKGTSPGIKYRVRIRSSLSSIVSSANNADLSINSCGATGIEERDMLGSMHVFPNPGTGVFIIHGEQGLDHLEIQVKNILGEIVYTNIAERVRPGFNITVNLSDLSNNVYLLLLKSGTSEVMQKLIKVGN